MVAATSIPKSALASHPTETTEGMVAALRSKPGVENYATCAGVYEEYPYIFQGKKVFYSKELNRVILNYEGCWKVTSFKYWPNIVSNPEMIQSDGFHRAQPEDDLLKSVWDAYTIEVLKEPAAKTTPDPEPLAVS